MIVLGSRIGLRDNQNDVKKQFTHWSLRPQNPNMRLISDLPLLPHVQRAFSLQLSSFLSPHSCSVVPWMEERRFWTFEAAVCFFGVISAVSVFIRQKQLDHKMYKRIQKQMTSGV